MKYIFTLWKGRNKCSEKGFSAGAVKKDLFNKSNKCSHCHKEFDLRYLELEHTIPVFIGGNIFDINNMTLMCKKCHNIKTAVDRSFIHFMKTNKVISGNNLFTCPYKIRKMYLFCFDDCLESRYNYRNWEVGINGLDYEQIMWKDNKIPNKKVKNKIDNKFSEINNETCTCNNNKQCSRCAYIEGYEDALGDNH